MIEIVASIVMMAGVIAGGFGLVVWLFALLFLALETSSAILSKSRVELEMPKTLALAGGLLMALSAVLTPVGIFFSGKAL